jgi:hypothetical protein
MAVERCLSFGGLTIDQAIDGEILHGLAPGAIEAACSGEAGTTEAAAAASLGGLNAELGFTVKSPAADREHLPPMPVGLVPMLR